MNGELAGTLDQRVTLIERADGRDALGGRDGAWTDGDTVWAAVRPLPAGADDAGAAPRWRVTVRADRVVRPGDRLRWGGRVLRVRGTLFDPATPDRLRLETEVVR